MKIWVGVTDRDWFEYLANHQADEVNFWQPSGGRRFRALQPGEPFLFKLHSPLNFIVGGGFFVRNTALPCSLAWSAFGFKNGVGDLEELLTRVAKYRRSDAIEHDPTIGCSILAEPFFFSEEDWIPVPTDWAKNIVQGKTYDSSEDHGADLWAAVQARLAAQHKIREIGEAPAGYGESFLTRARLGQGAFRVLVTEAYKRRCAITGERTLPVLEASHIKPFASEGPNKISNGLLLRSDLHILFDRGYLTLTPSLNIEVSRRIREEFENGREYYAYHGKPLAVKPETSIERPATEFLSWHNEHVFESTKSPTA